MSSDITPHETSHYRMYTDERMGRKGRKLFCYYWEPKQKPRALLLISHGFTDHTMLYESLAKEMAKRGFFVFANDHIGHGRSGGARGHVSNVGHLVEDTTAHIKAIKVRYLGTPLFLWGHSMGGAISFLTSIQKNVVVNGLIAVAAALTTNPETATPLRLIAAKVFGCTLPFFPVAFADVSLSCRNKEQIQRLNADPLRFHGYFKARTVCALLKAGDEIMKRKEEFDIPLLVLHGDDDKVCNIQGSQIFHEGCASKDKKFVLYPGAYHSLFQEPEEVSMDVLHQSIEWLEQRAPEIIPVN